MMQNEIIDSDELQLRDELNKKWIEAWREKLK